MPRWEVHASFGLMALLMISSAVLLGIMEGSDGPFPWGASHNVLVPLLLGSGALMVGSVLPDLDGKGKVRWVIGPLIGAMALVPPMTGYLLEGGITRGSEFLLHGGAAIFLMFTIFGYMVLMIPLNHRGRLHSTLSGLWFGAIWGAYVLATSSIPLEGALLAGSMAALGYSWHLALDGRLLGV